MGNPDQPTPEHIVEKLVEAARRSDTHRYSASRGIPRLRCAIAKTYSGNLFIRGKSLSMGFWRRSLFNS
jgi:aspartate/methionine/tyrosine aminotransferase